MNCFPESNPDIEQTQTTAGASNKAMSDEGTQVGVREQKAIVSPFRVPGENDKKHTHGGTEEDKKQDSEPVSPKSPATMQVAGRGRIILQCRVGRGRRSQPYRLCMAIFKGYFGIRNHAALPFVVDSAGVAKGLTRAPRSKTKPILAFYDFRALMRSATSR
jgi:hypothetical protein